MSTTHDSTFKATILTHFVPCLFAGVALLYVLNAFLGKTILSRLMDSMFTVEDYIAALLLGCCVAVVAVLYHLRRNRHLHKWGASRRPAERKEMINAALVGFLAGAGDILLLLHTEGILALTLIVALILYWNLSLFSRNITTMLHPGSVATWGDVAELSRIYLTMLAGFTLVNATLEGLHHLTGSGLPFGFMERGDLFLNSLYYTVVTMTTLGFGDIVPRTWDAKLLLIVECLVSYVMFALVIGIITRGVVRGSEKNGA